MFIINLTDPKYIFIALLISILFIILGKEFKKSLLPAITLGIFLVLIILHAYQSIAVTDNIYKAIITKSIGVDAVFIFISYISYLWIDDIESKDKNRKSIDNSLDWFWKKI